MPASVPDQALYQFNSSPPPAWHRRASMFLIKLLWKRGKSRRGRSCGEAFFRRSKILHRSAYSALWLGGLPCQYRRQTGHWLLAVPAWWSFAKKQTKKHSVGPLSASAHRENARYARLPVQPWSILRHGKTTWTGYGGCSQSSGGLGSLPTHTNIIIHSRAGPPSPGL